MNTKIVAETVYSIIIFGGGYLIGYYIATLREHKRAMQRLDALRRDIEAIGK